MKSGVFEKLPWFLVSELVIPGLWVFTSCCNDSGGRRGWLVRTGFRYYLFHGTRPARDRFERETTAIRYEDGEKASGAARRFD